MADRLQIGLKVDRATFVRACVSHAKELTDEEKKFPSILFDRTWNTCDFVLSLRFLVCSYGIGRFCLVVFGLILSAIFLKVLELLN